MTGQRRYNLAVFARMPFLKFCENHLYLGETETTDANISNWDLSLLNEAASVVRLYAQTWDLLHSQTKDSFHYEIQDKLDGYEKGFENSRNHLLALLKLKENCNLPKSFSWIEKEVTSTDGKANPKSNFPKTDTEIAESLMVPAQALFKLMKDLKRNGFLDALEWTKDVAFPLYDLSTFKWESEFTLDVIARTDDEKDFLQKNQAVVRYKENEGVKSSAPVFSSAREHEGVVVAYENMDWASASKKCLSEEQFLYLLVHPYERIQMNRRFGKKFLDTVRGFRSFVENMEDLKEGRHPDMSKYYYSTASNSFRHIDTSSLEDNSPAHHDHDECELEGKVRIAQANQFPARYALECAEVIFKVLQETFSQLHGTRENFAVTYLPKTLLTIQSVFQEEKTRWESEFVPALSEKMLQEEERNKLDRLRSKKEQEEIREKFLKDPGRSAKLTLKEYAKVIIDPELLDHRHVYPSYKPLFKAAQIYELTNLLCSTPDLVEVVSKAPEKSLQLSSRPAERNLLKIIYLIKETGSIPEEKKEIALKTAEKTLRSSMNRFRPICPLTVKSVGIATCIVDREETKQQANFGCNSPHR